MIYDMDDIYMKNIQRFMERYFSQEESKHCDFCETEFKNRMDKHELTSYNFMPIGTTIVPKDVHRIADICTACIPKIKNIIHGVDEEGHKVKIMSQRI